MQLFIQLFLLVIEVENPEATVTVGRETKRVDDQGEARFAVSLYFRATVEAPGFSPKTLKGKVEIGREARHTVVLEPLPP